MSFLKSKKGIEVKEYPGLVFIPVHQLKVENEGNEPYIKTVKIGDLPEFNFFKVKGQVYIIKPSSKPNKHLSKLVAAKVLNPLTIRSAQGSITGNCARGVKQEYIDYLNNLSRSTLTTNEVFIHVATNIDKLK